MIAALIQLALAHGGEDHGVVAATSSTAISGTAATGTSFDTVVRLPAGLSGSGTLLVADWATSAPVRDGSGTLTLSPGALQVEFAPTASPGVWTAPVTFPAAGSYAGALVVSSEDRTDLIAMSDITVGSVADAPAEGSLGSMILLAVAFAAALVVVALLSFVVGRRSAAAAAVLLVGLGAERVQAHGGEDHGAPAPLPATGGGLSLRMESQFLLQVRTQPIVRDEFAAQVEALGRFLAPPGASATLRAPVSGLLRAPGGGFPAPGQDVRPGDVLAILEETAPVGDRAALSQAVAETYTRLAEARSALALAERDVAQAAELGGAISERERLVRAEAVRVARETVRQAEVAAGAFRTRAEVRAPVAGRLARALAFPGDHVEAGEPLFRVIGGGAPWIEVEVPEGTAVLPGTAALVASRALAGQLLEATVLDAGQEVDVETGHITVTLAAHEASGAVRPGMAVRAWIDAGPAREAVIVPDAAVVESNGETLVFVKTGPETFAMRPVRLGGQAGDRWEVISGLQPGERVVVDGTYTLRSLAGR